MMWRKGSMQCAVLVYFAVLFIQSGNTKNTLTKPNIVFILADDYGYNDIGYHGSEIKTPNLDQLAKEGVKLENYYVQPVCSPTRSQLLSGRYQIHTGLQHGIIHDVQPNGLPLDSPTIADKIKEAGYSTYMVGKWHLGFYKEAYTPWKRGFDNYFGYLTGSEDYFNHTRRYTGPKPPSSELEADIPSVSDVSGVEEFPEDDFLEYPSEDEMVGRKDGKYYLDLRENETPIRDQNGTYSALMFSTKAVSIVNEHDTTKPLFMYLAYQSVHAPLQVPSYYEKKYPNIKDYNRRVYAGMVSAMDEGIGNLTQALKSRGMWENTILVFSTDNGGQVLAGGNNFPLRGWKGSLWEGGIHGVGFVSGGALKLRGVVNRELIHVSDWFPTLVHLAGGNLNGTKPLDGYNQWESISTGSPGNRKVLLHNIDILRSRRGRPLYKDTFDTSIRAAVRKGDMKLITGFPGNDSWVPPPGQTLFYVPEQSTLQRPVRKNVWLFNITADPYEHNDLSDAMPDMVRSLLDLLLDFNNTAVPPRFPKGDWRSNPSLHGGVWGPWET